jgi:hypothetical protein
MTDKELIEQLADKEHEEVTLASLRPGALFVTHDGIMAVKSEYVYSSDNPQCECILLESGEYAHFPDGNRTLVREISVVRPSRQNDILTFS